MSQSRVISQDSCSRRSFMRSMAGGAIVAVHSPLIAQENPAKVEFDQNRAWEYLKQVCEIGARFSGSPGMDRQQKLIASHFEKLKVKVQFQSFDAVHPLNGKPVRMNNIITSFHPAAKDRVLICCHYDTRPFPDEERVLANRNKPFIGANDGGSGVALLMELAHHITNIKPTYGVDFVFFDGEELIFGDRGTFFLGSEYFAKQYKDNPPPHRYVYGVLVDMIADTNLAIYQELNSLKLAPEPTASVWATAKRLGVAEFKQQPKHEIRDDHLPLNEIAGIPTCDIIDFDYPYWHTTRDNLMNCSRTSLFKVGRVLLAWLESAPK